MKKRADYILEKIGVNRENVANINFKTSTKYVEEKSAEDNIFNNTINKENIVPSHHYEITHETGSINLTDINLPESTHGNDKNISRNPSMIENSPDRSLPYNDPKMFLPHNRETKIVEFSVELEPEHSSEKTILSGGLEKEQSKKSHVSSSSSSSSSCSSRSLSTSSSSSSDKSNKTNPVIDGPSTSKSTGKEACRTKKNYRISPINSNESDVDLSDSDPSYTVHRSRSRLRKSSSSSTNSSPHSNKEINDISSAPETNRKSKKRQRNPSKWKQNIAKILRNSGKAYFSCTTKKEIPARSVKGPCKCKLKCSENINDVDRTTLFQSYWSIGNIELQRSYIRSCMMEIQPRYKYTNADKPRLPKNAFYFTVNNVKIRVCKTFFINTLDICDRQIRTVKNKTDPQGFISKDIRGKHSSRKPTDPILIESIKQHINSIPRIESHYLRASTSREYISGDKTIRDIWRDFDKMQKDQGNPTCDYWLYYDIFNKQFNISFFQPKKDRCDLCFDFELATPNRKIEIKNKYDNHLKEKNLCRQEKRLDRQNINEVNICAVYDLQAVMQCPTGETSSFYYKSKLNCFNFTIVEMLKKTETVRKRTKNGEEAENEIGAYGNVYSYFWDEIQGKRGANEIGSCVLDYLRRLNEQNPNKKMNVTFYSDNTYSQNKYKYKYINLKNLKISILLHTNS